MISWQVVLLVIIFLLFLFECQYLFPYLREWILGLGGVSAGRESISYLLRKPGIIRVISGRVVLGY